MPFTVSLFFEVFLECEVQQENNNSGNQYWLSTGKDIVWFLVIL